MNDTCQLKTCGCILINDSILFPVGSHDEEREGHSWVGCTSRNEEVIRPSATAKISPRVGWYIGRDTFRPTKAISIGKILRLFRHQFSKENTCFQKTETVPPGATGAIRSGFSSSRKVRSNGIVTEESLDDLLTSNGPGATS